MPDIVINRRGVLLILSSPSGAGKSTLARRLLAWDPTVEFSISATTRPPRPNEQNGREYHFCTRAVFEDMVKRDEMLEHATVFGHLYGSPRAPVAAAIANGRDVVFDIDWQGGQQIRASTLAVDVVSVFVLPPSIAALHGRLVARGQDADTTVIHRMAMAQDEINHWHEYDYVLVNHDIDQSVAQIQAIVTAERSRRMRQEGLDTFVTGLNTEFMAREKEFQNGTV